jgi:hypothetical protein
MSIYICSRLISYEQPDDRAPALRQFNTLSIALIVSPPVGALTPTQIDDRLGTAKSQTRVHGDLSGLTIGDESFAAFNDYCNLVR